MPVPLPWSLIYLNASLIELGKMEVRGTRDKVKLKIGYSMSTKYVLTALSKGDHRLLSDS